MMVRVYHFRDLSPDMQDALTKYIKSHFTVRPSINPYVSAYGLMQPFIRTVRSEERITSRCFTEAMELCGFRSRPIENTIHSEPNWRFNVYVLQTPRDL